MSRARDIADGKFSGDLEADSPTFVVDSANNRVGIGTSSPLGRLAVQAATGLTGFNTGTSSSPERGNLWYDTDGTGWKFNIGKLQGGTFTPQMTFQDNGTVGIGTSSPAAQLHVANSGGNSTSILGQYGSGTRAEVTAASNEVVIKAYNGTNDVMTFYTGASERMRIDASGNLLVGTTTSSNARITLESGVNQNAINMTAPTFNYNVATFHNKGTSGDNALLAFATEASFTTRGSITYNRAGGLIAYNTTSDYRAKDIAGPIEDASSTVLSLKPYMGTMKGATAERPMFVAHETQEVAPYAVTGEKDAVDQNGNPKYQQMDHSALVPLLTAALQEALNKIEALEARITALEAQP